MSIRSVNKIMQKDFDEWNKKKTVLNNRMDLGNIYFREREIWWAALGINIGFEQDGKGNEFRRPVLIIKKFNQYIAIVVPLTTKLKNNKYYVSLNTGDGVERAVIISQVRIVDSKRFIDKMGVLDKMSFQIIKNAIKDMF